MSLSHVNCTHSGTGPSGRDSRAGNGEGTPGLRGLGDEVGGKRACRNQLNFKLSESFPLNGSYEGFPFE